MLTFQDFFVACAGLWKTERIYHFLQSGEIERSYTEFQAAPVPEAKKQSILTAVAQQSGDRFQLDFNKADLYQACPGFAISFNTESETGEKVSMQLHALFVPDTYILQADQEAIVLPLAAEIATGDPEVIQGFYLRDEGYSESGAIAGRFTYQPVRQTLEMTTFYNRSVAVDQMRFVAPDVRMRTIATYQRPAPGERPTVLDLIGFGVERKHPV